MPDAYLFDIGNVIITFDFRISAGKLAGEAAVPAEEILSLVSPLTVDLELGRLSPEQFIAEASSRIGYTGTPERFHSVFADIFELNEPMAAFITELKAAGTPLYLLSNTNGIHAPFFEATYPVFGLFDGGIYSHEVGLMKPDPAIYERVRTDLRLVPERTVYIDDNAANCVAGEAAGFLSIPYDVKRHEAFLDAVARLHH
jgi:HAD superfamily hydrolase (TIGR01509 family)